MKLSTRKFSKIKFIDFHTHKQASQAETLQIISVELDDLKNMAMENVDCSFFSIGMHPWRLPPDTDSLRKDILTLRKTLKIAEVIAIGEVGLDRLWGPDIEIQKKYLFEIFKVAEEFNMPLIIHCVKSYPELISIRKKFSSELKMLIHGFNGKALIMEELFKYGFHISLGSAALKRDDICEYIHQKPTSLHRICLETDDSGLNIQDVFKHAAQVFEIDLEELIRFMKTNFISLFQVK